MCILGIDTSFSETSVALLGDGTTPLYSIRLALDNTHSRNLLDLVEKALFSTGLTTESITAVACGIGPGSFTGLRIGLGTALGIGDSIGAPVIGAGTLTSIVLAHEDRSSEYLSPLLTACKAEVYTAVFRRTEDGFERITRDMVIRPEELPGMIDGPVQFIGDGFEPYARMFRDQINSRVTAVDRPSRPVSYGVASFAREYIRNGKISEVPPVPCYVRKSQAEINREKLQSLT